MVFVLRVNFFDMIMLMKKSTVNSYYLFAGFSLLLLRLIHPVFAWALGGYEEYYLYCGGGYCSSGLYGICVDGPRSSICTIEDLLVLLFATFMIIFLAKGIVSTARAVKNNREQGI